MPEEQLLAELSAAEIFAIHPAGDMVAYVNQGLELLRLSDGYRQRLLFDTPDAILWTADGRQLVVALPQAEKTRLVKLTTDENKRTQVFVDEQITDFAWLTDGRLLAMAQQIEEHEGTVQVRVVLLIWDGGREVERKPLYRFSYPKPISADRPFAERIVHRFDLSPLKDELIYGRYLEPPVPVGRVEQVLYNLQTGREVVLAENSSQQSDAFLAADAEHVLLAKRGEGGFFNPWTSKAKYRWPVRGTALQMAAGRELFLIDGQLFSGDQLLLTLPPETWGQFSQDGSRLFVVNKQKLYLVDDYFVPGKTQFSDLEKARLQNIRQQRSRGEISIRSYYQARNNILHP
jgi:hypothetical protein